MSIPPADCRFDEPIAILGMACRLPGAASLEEYWRLLESGGSAVAELPPERFNERLYFDPRKGVRGKSYSNLAALLADRQFDRASCPIPPSLEQSVDNAHLLMCEVAAAACRHAGLDPFNLPLRNTGVYIGHAQGSDLSGDLTFSDCVEEAAELLRDVADYQSLAASEQGAIIGEFVAAAREGMPMRSADSPDASINVVAGTVSKAFGLTGPYVALNAACASSLQAIQFAARALQTGRIDMAIAGGASDCKEGSMVLFSIAQTLSATGSCPFDDNADGLIISEGYVAVVLKTLSRALADGDAIQAIIPAMGCSSDGKGKSLWAPRKEGQIKAMERAYSSGLDIGSLQFVEAHATSTSLGDATELSALAEVFAGKVAPGKKVPVTSVKANIGHSLEAAGIAGLIKTVLCMQHRQIVAAINIRALNSKIDWAGAPIYVPLENESWPEQIGGGPRRAAVNAFGIGGLNMHVVVEEFTEQRRADLVARYVKPSRQAPDRGSDEQAIAIIGRGCIFSGAGSVDAFWRLIESGHDPKTQAPPGRWRSDLALAKPKDDPGYLPTTLGGYITDFVYDWKRHKVPPIQVQQADPLQFMLLDATEQALADAGYDRREFDRTRVAVLVGTESGGDFGTQLCVSLRLPMLEEILIRLLGRRGIDGQRSAKVAAEFSKRVLKHWPALVDESGSFSTSTLASRITKTMNLMGGAVAIDAGSASAAVALAIGVDKLLAGDCDMLVCAGGQRCMNLPKYKSLYLAGALATDEKPASPFDASASGIVPGEGVGVVLLKRLADARRDGDRIQAVIRGVGMAHSNDADRAWSLAIERAAVDSGIKGSEVALVETDGSGLADDDASHVRAIAAASGERSSQVGPLALGTVVGQIGHTVGASAMASLIAATLAVEHGAAPANFGSTKPLTCIAEQAGAIRLATRPEKLGATKDGRRFAAVDSFNKGLATQIILERGEKVMIDNLKVSVKEKGASAVAPVVRPALTNSAMEKPLVASTMTSGAAAAAPSDWIIYRLGLASPAELQSKLAQALSNPRRTFETAGSSQFSGGDHARLAIVASSADQLAERLQTVSKQRASEGFDLDSTRVSLERHGCFYRLVPAKAPQVAFLFPGQGSQYAGMLRELVGHVPAAATMLRTLDEVLIRGGYPTFEQMAWERADQLGVDIWLTQLSMLVADLIVHAAVTSYGVKPDIVAGHSLGEYAALTAAGAWDPEGVILAVRARFEAIRATLATGSGLMAVAAAPTEIEPLAAALADRVYIANHNAPEQSIVGGRAESLENLATLLKARGHQSQMLAVPCAYHTPLLAGAGDLLQRSLGALVVRPPRTPLISTVTNRYVAEPDEIRANLAAQLTTPVRYVDLIQRIAADQPTVLLEVGPQRTLTNLHQRILAGQGLQSQWIACDNPKRPAVESLLNVRALLECLGVNCDANSVADFPASSIPRPATARGRGSVVLIDATEKRRERMRQASAQGNGHLVAPAARAIPQQPSIDLAPRQPATWDEPPSAPPAAKRIADSAPPSEPARKLKSIAATASTPVESPPIPAPARNGHFSGDLEKFLINFVVEHTGYPPEAVDLDSDLEADLGIDSIKKAQLFAELAEYFDARPTAGMTLDAFPTLRHALNFLSAAPTPETAPVSAVLSQAPSAAPRFESPAVASIAVNRPAESAPTVSAVFSGASVATAPAIQSQPSAGHPAAAAAPGTLDLEKFLVNFVVEQTGYPPEAVDLDSDLEADLGIDSIKKAQLFAELSEYFDARPAEGMTLDDFPTLRHALNFLVTADLKKKALGSRDDSASPAALAIDRSSPHAPQTGNPPADDWITRLGGTPYEMGLAHGRRHGKAIRRLLRRFADLADGDFDNLSTATESNRKRRASFTADELDELRGIADALGAPLDGLLAVNLAIDSDRSSAAIHFAGRDKRQNRLVHLARYEAPWPAALSDCLAPMIALRCPAGGHPYLTLSYAGIVGSLAGVNSHGVSVTVAGNPRSRGSRTQAQTAQRILAEASHIDQIAKIHASQVESDELSVYVSHISTGAVKHLGSMKNPDAATVQALLDHVDGQSPSGAKTDHDVIVFSLDSGDASLSIEDCRLGLRRVSLNGFWPKPPSAKADQATIIASAMALDGLESKPDDQTRRYVMRMKPTPLPSSTPNMPILHGAALVVGANAASDALSQRLQSAGATVHRIEGLAAVDSTIAKLDELWRLGAIPHLFLMMDRDLAPLDLHDESGWRGVRQRAIDAPLFFTQRWIQLAGEANLLPQCTLVAATALGGDFGFSSELASPLGAALAGMIKAIYIEIAYLAGHKSLRAKAIDFVDDESPERLAACVCREMAGQTVDYEIGYVDGQRYLPCGYSDPAPTPRANAIRPGGVWVFTGGATGITARCALELGKRFNLKLHLIGRSPRPTIDPACRNLADDGLKSLKTTIMREARLAGRNMDEAWRRVERDLEIDRTLHEFSEAGLDVAYHACDVADAAALAAVLQSIRTKSGPIEGIVHGAGVERASRFERKQREHVLPTIASKIDGALNLMRLTWADPVRHFFGFGSISGRMGSNGQVDYCLASDLLCKLVAWYADARPGVQAIGFHWHSWSEVGMAAKPETTRAMKSTSGPELMAKREGLQHFLRELLAGAPQREVLITTPEYHARYYKLDEIEPKEATPTEQVPWAPWTAPRVATRHRLTTIPAPLPTPLSQKPRINGPVWILGDNSSSAALRDRLIADGAKVDVLPIDAALSETQAAMDSLFRDNPPRHVFLMTARDDEPMEVFEHDRWLAGRVKRVVNPLLAVQHLLRLRRKAGEHGPMDMVAVTALGGDFGLSGSTVVSPEGGALCGLLKSLFIEDSRLERSEARFKIIDVPSDEPLETLVDAILQELAADDPQLEVAWSRAQRKVIRSVAEPVESLPQSSRRPSGTWVVTGGARGITAAAAAELARRFGVKLHLIGRSPLPSPDAAWRSATPERLAEIKSQIVRDALAQGRSPETAWEKLRAHIEIDETLRRFAAEGIRATYHACDLADWPRLSKILQQIRETDGPIEGVVHGAGYGKSGRFDTRPLDSIERTITGKLDGAVAMMALTWRDPIKYWIGFGSLSGRFGGNGLGDYAAANDMVAKLVDWYRVQRSDVAATCFHWQSWDEVGMAMLGDSAAGTKNILKMNFLSPREGIEHFCREIEAGLPSGEVLITDGFFERTFHPRTAEHAEPLKNAVAANVETNQVSARPLIIAHRRREDVPGLVGEMIFDPTADPFLLDHQFRGKPFLPAVIAMEAMAETASIDASGPIAALKDVEFVTGLRFPTERPLSARVVGSPADSGAIQCQLVSDFVNRSGVTVQSDRLHARCVATTADNRDPITGRVSPPTIDWQAFRYPTDSPMLHGPTFQALTAACFAGGRGWGKVTALRLGNLGGPARGGDWVVPATVLDAAFYVCGLYVWLHVRQSASLPVALGNLRLGRLPRGNEQCLIQTEFRGVVGSTALFDFTAVGDNDDVILSVIGYRCQLLGAEK